MATRALSKRHNEFFYDRVCKNILQMIREDNLQPGDRLPSERELSRRFGLNHQTVRKGLAVLVDENVIDRRVGSGTFLRSVPEEGTLQLLKPHSVGGGRGGPSAETRSRTSIGVIAMTRASTFFTEMLNYLHDEAESRGLQLVLRMVSDFGSRASEAIRQLADQGCNSILIPWRPEILVVSELTQLVQESPIPVATAFPLPGLEKHCYEKPGEFGKADHVAVEMACKYLHALGYGHIAFFGPDTLTGEDLSRRVLAYNRFTSRQGLGSFVGLVRPEAEDVDRIVRGWSSMAGDLAVLCYDDDFAIRLMTALHKMDLRIPEDVAVLGFNNIPLGKATDPPLSTIQFDYGYVARSLIEHAQAMANGALAQASGHVREVLVIRESCGGRARCGERLSEIIEQSQSYWKSASTDAM